MPLLGGPVAACALLLVLGGATKLGRPNSTVHALRTLGIPVASVWVRLLAVSEVAIGFAAVAIGGRLPALLMAVSYLGFAGFVVLAMTRRGPVSSCGCFGTPDTPPTVTHLLVTLAAAAVAGAGAAHPVDRLLDRLPHQPLGGAPFVILTGCCVWLAYAALAVLPRTTALSRRRAA